MYDFPLVTDKWWALEFRAFYYDDKLFKSFDPYPKNKDISEMGNSAFAVVDTGTSMMAVPEGFFSRLEQRWKSSVPNPADVSCIQGLCVGGHSCEYFYDKLGNITVQLGNEDFAMMPQGYLLDGADLDP